MRGRLAAGRLAALVLGVLITGVGIANSARAFEWDLPGERKFSIHGFYEARLLFTGEDLPAHAVTFSQFRHVLSLELELSLFPDGFGPFDSMFMFTRILASYDCIYTRACGLFASADSYGDAARDAVRQPGSLKDDVKNKSSYFGGLLKNKYIPGTLSSPVETLNPSRRYRQCDNPPGIFQNPFPLSAFCNLNQRSPLDGPLKPGITTYAIAIRGGDFGRLARESLLSAARPTLGEPEFIRLRALLINGNVLSIPQEGLRRTLIVESIQAKKAGDTERAKAAQEEADAILGSPVRTNDPNVPVTFDANVTNLLKTRPDPNRFAIFSRQLAPDLFKAKWGSNKIGTAITPFLATINTEINPKGYFSNATSVNWFGEFETGLADDLRGSIAGAPVTADADGTTVIAPETSVKKAVPFFLGPDGIRDTADDLPFVKTNARGQQAGYTLAAPISGTNADHFDDLDGGVPIYTETAQISVPTAANPTVPKLVELYGVFNPTTLTRQGCSVLGGTFDPTRVSCGDSTGANITSQALALGCLGKSRQFTGRTDVGIGVNADGDCIEINNSPPNNNDSTKNLVQYEVLALLADQRARPAQAKSEPVGAADLLLFANYEGSGIPARPRLKNNGIVYPAPGTSSFYATHKAVVSRLDLHFNEDELQWNHGASQKEHEFAEGYVEMEMADSQIFAKVGKLIQVWGKTELFRNQDRNNPLDIGNGLFAPLEESRVGQWAADVTFSPEMFMRVGPVEDLRLEVLWIFNRFEPTDLGKCGEGGAVDLICLKSLGAIASGLAGIGIAGERRPDKDYNGMATWDYGARIEGRLDRFTFAISDFYGWDDGFYLDLVQQYERTADVQSGAPLATGQRAGGQCRVRKNAAGQAVGPNGIPGDGDDIFATDGQCLLWGKPFQDPNNPNNPENGRQHLRAPEAIAALHNVNQTLFHSVCAFTFDQDEGYCAFDRLNAPATFGPISSLLAGFGTIGAIVLEGTQTIRPTGLGELSFAALSSTPNVATFQTISTTTPTSRLANDVGIALIPEQSALLGCGAAYASPCSDLQATQWGADPAIFNSLKRSPTEAKPQFGGVDLMNADASVITMEFTALKAISPGALVGTRLNSSGQLEYQPGMNYTYDGTFEVVRVGSQTAIVQRGHTDPITPDQAKALNRTGRALYQKPTSDDPDGKQVDGWIEPMPWKIDPEIKKKFGAIVFQNDPVHPLDPNSPLNVWNLIDKKKGPTINTLFDNVDGEYCERWLLRSSAEADVKTPFNTGCTGLETISANFERFLIATEIIGFDRIFDPPESLTELGNWGSNNTAKQEHGDPIAGPDGIFVRNARVFDDEEVDYQVQPTVRSPGTIIDAPADKAAARLRLLNFNPVNECPGTAKCFMNVAPIMTDPTDVKYPAQIRSQLINLPISTPAEIVDEPNDPSLPPVILGTTKVNPAALQLTDVNKLAQLMTGQVVEINGQFVRFNKEQREGAGSQNAGLFGKSEIGRAAVIDINNDALNDLDQDRDGVWDGADDYSPGPITDDNILCGTGIRGDPYQDVPQYEPYRLDEAVGSSKFKKRFPNGLPPRSPVFCRSIAGIVGGTTQTLPVKKAGGDGRFGRRDFLWQGGRQVATRYQKRNVFGFGLDFAEDVTKTSWGVEFSWMARKLFNDTREFSGLTQSDELVLSLSVDRPTFFNFLNPNRSFFLNFQMFLRYLPNYQGGSASHDGMWGSAAGPLTTQMVLTFFTGYFQDRLAPRVSTVWWPMESQGAVLSGLSYRWNDAFSTSIGYSSFFGHVGQTQGAYFPIAQYGSIEQYNGATLRGAAPVLNRDQMEVRFRYTW